MSCRIGRQFGPGVAVQIEVSTGLVALIVTVGGVVVSAAATMLLAARDARDAVRDVERHADALVALQVARGQHDTRLDAHDHDLAGLAAVVATQAQHATRIATLEQETSGLRQRAHDLSNTLARVVTRCDLEHGGE